MQNRDDILRISPLPRQRARRIPVATLSPDGKLTGEVRPRIVYSRSALPCLRLARKQGGEALLLRTAGSTRWVKFTIGGVDYYPSCATDNAAQVIAFRDHCYDRGISARSIQAMAFYLMRSTLAGYFDVHTGTGIPFHLFPSGPRTHAIPGLYRDVYQADITAAYLWGIGRFTPAKAWRECKATATEVASVPGSWALCRYVYPRRVRMGAMPYLSHSGTTIFPEERKRWTGDVLLSSEDIRCGIASGSLIRIRKAWMAIPTAFEPFAAFLWEIWRMRESGEFPALAKQAGNTLWGSFVASGNLAGATFRPDGSHRIHEIPPRDSLCRPIGFGVLAKLRARLFMELIGTETIHAHTDGAISTRCIVSDIRAPGNIRMVSRFAEAEILTPSWYRTVSEDGTTAYKLAGRPEKGERAAKSFRNFREKMLEVDG